MLRVEADVPNPGPLRPGLFASAAIIVNEGEQTLTVPTNAVVSFAGLEKVVLVADNKARERDVSTGRRHGDRVEILSGLTAGEGVVLDPSGLRTGQRVTRAEPRAEVSAATSPSNAEAR
jgi:multidrug efflux pump subunit AcrA (membrane-fusion protein)